MKKSFFVKFIFFLCLAVVFAIPIAKVYASTEVNGPDVNVDNSSSYGNLYLFGSTVNDTALVHNDLVAAGSTVTINGNVDQSLIVAGSQVTINGNVSQNVRIAASSVIINGNVGQDVSVLASTLTVNKNVGGDLFFAGSVLTINGTVDGNVHTRGDSFVLNGHVGNYVDAKVNTLTIASKASIGRDLDYSADTYKIPSNTVLGSINKEAKTTNNSALSFIDITGFILRIMFGLIVCLLFLLLFPTKSLHLVEQTMSEPLVSFVGGGCSLVLFPFLLIPLLILIIGIPVILLYLIFVFLALALGGMLFGSILYKYINHRSDYTVNWLTIVVGVCVTTIIFYIPFFGGLFALLLFILTLGGLLTVSFNYFRRNR